MNADIHPLYGSLLGGGRWVIVSSGDGGKGISCPWVPKLGEVPKDLT